LVVCLFCLLSCLQEQAQKWFITKFSGNIRAD
jgi:hypothetical protein